MVRCFVAIPLPGEIRERLALLGGGVPGARWVPPENMHLTLRFIGEVDEGCLEDIDMALGRIDVRPFAISLGGVGQFSIGRKPRVIWVGVAPSEALAHLQAKVESAVVRSGVPPEDRKFSPHVTLARLKEAPANRVGRFVQAHGLFAAGPIQIDHFTLFESLPGRDGPQYRSLRHYPLGEGYGFDPAPAGTE